MNQTKQAYTSPYLTHLAVAIIAGNTRRHSETPFELAHEMAQARSPSQVKALEPVSASKWNLTDALIARPRRFALRVLRVLRKLRELRVLRILRILRHFRVCS
jgi:hypothetical protein